MPHVWPALEAALESPSLYDDVIAALARTGLSIDPGALERDWSEGYTADDSVEAAWRRVYQDPTADNELYQVGEALLSIDQQFSIYRWRHFVTLERIIGYKPGTGGSAGIEWLEQVTRHHFFPELWAIRS